MCWHLKKCKGCLGKLSSCFTKCYQILLSDCKGTVHFRPPFAFRHPFPPESSSIRQTGYFDLLGWHLFLQMSSYLVGPVPGLDLSTYRLVTDSVSTHYPFPRVPHPPFSVAWYCIVPNSLFRVVFPCRGFLRLFSSDSPYKVFFL